MAISHFRGRRKPSGGRYKYRAKKKRHIGSLPTLTKLGKRKLRVTRGRAAILKQRLLSEETANVYNPKTKKYSKSKIITVSANTANRNFVRRNIITKGAVIKTELGEAKVTSRPGQVGTINAVLIEK